MVAIRWFFAIAVLLTAGLLHANPVDSASTIQKGYFGEELVDSIWQAAGRKSISTKVNPILNGPDRIYIARDGMVEIHEVKAWSGWGGKQAMRTTFDGGKPTYELSREWLEHWIAKTLRNPLASSDDVATAKTVGRALKSGKYRLIFDEINLSTREIRFSAVTHVGSGEVKLSQLAGPTKIKYFERKFNKSLKNLANLPLNSVAKTMERPKIWMRQNPLSKSDFVKTNNNLFNAKTMLRPGMLTADGKLLVSLGEGAINGLLVFGVEGGISCYSYLNGDILKPEFEEKLIDAAIKGSAVSGCTAVAVVLGATPGGWVVMAVGAGGYLIADTAIKVWREYQANRYLTVEDLEAWGIEADTVLDIEIDSVLDLEIDSVLSLEYDSVLDLETDSVLSFL